MGTDNRGQPRSPQRLEHSPVRRPCAGGAIADAALGLEGAVVGVVSVAAAGLVALLGGKAVERSP